MLKNACCVCKLFALLVIVGAINWGIIAVLQVNYIARFLPPVAARIVYGVIGVAGLLMLLGFFVACPKCGKCDKAGAEK